MEDAKDLFLYVCFFPPFVWFVTCLVASLCVDTCRSRGGVIDMGSCLVLYLHHKLLGQEEKNSSRTQYYE